MAYLGFAKEFSRNRTIAAGTKLVRGNYNLTQEGMEKATLETYKNGAQALGKAKEAYAAKFGLPSDLSSEQEKAQYKDFMANYGSQIKAAAQQRAGELQSAAYEKTASNIREAVKNNPNFTASDAENILSAGWSNQELHTGVMDIFNKTADARATALGITRFRGTDGAMGTLGSIGSLLYKDDSHLSNNVMIAGALGGAAVAGIAAGKVSGAGLDAALVDRD